MLKEDKRILALVVISMLAFAVVFGLVCRFYILPVYAKEDTTEVTSQTTTEFTYTSEEQEILDGLLQGELPELEDPDDVDQVLNVTGKWLDINAPKNTKIVGEELTETASETDADWDPTPYLSYSLEDRWIEDSDTVQKGLDDIYRMLLSLRNCVIVFMAGCFLVWAHKSLKGVVYRLNGRGLK